MSIAFGQQLGAANFGASSTTTVLSISKTVAVGDLICVGQFYFATAGTTSCADNLGNTYTFVEQAENSSRTTAFLYSIATVGGTLTTVTVTHPTATYRGINAFTLTGVGSYQGVGGGLNGASGVTVTWANSVTIPAYGCAVGFGGTNSDPSFSAGSASGSPSTSITMSYDSGDGNCDLAGFYAIAGSGAVSTFSGTGTMGGSNVWSGAGAVFNAPNVPVWTTPADTVSMSTTPDLKFNSPTSASKQHFYMQLDTANTFDTGNLRTYDSSVSQTNWTYWDGASWTALPSDGLPIAKAGNEVDYTVTSALSAGTWYRRVRAGTLT
jgi:hypothetical protein